LQLPETIERETFHQFGRLITNSYRRTIRGLVFLLKKDSQLREKVISGEVTVTKLVTENKKV